MNKILGLALFALSIAAPASFAVVMYGELTIDQPKCIRAPCPPFVKFSTGAGKRFSVRAEKGSAAESFLDTVRVDGPDDTIRVSVVGRIERENLLIVTEIIRTAAPTKGFAGVLTVNKVMCMTSPCPASARLTAAPVGPNKGATYSVQAVEGTQAENYLDRLNQTLGGKEEKINVTVEGELENGNSIQAKTITPVN